MLTAALLSALALAPPAGPPEIRVHGNVVMPEEVYRSVLNLPPDAPADVDTATLVREQLLSFLLRAGYELAQVHVALADNAFDVDIDEGQLEKVVFRGKLTLQTLRFKLALLLPYDVFNRPELDRQIKALTGDLKLEHVWYELVPTQQVAHIGPQVEQLPTLQGLQLVHARRRYELHVFFTEHEWDSGFWFDLKSGFPDGTELGAVLQGSHLLFADDRFRLVASGGVNLRQSILDQHFYLAPSHEFGELRYFLPFVGHGLGRPFIWVIAEGTQRQRQDLCFENYVQERAEATLNLQYQPASRMTISYGGGSQFRRIFGEDTPNPVANGQATSTCSLNPTPPPYVQSNAGPYVKGFRSFGLLRTDLVFDKGAERWDRRHAVWAEARYYVGARDPTDGHVATYGEIRSYYQKVWPLGWHDFWLRARGAWLWGDVFFHDEEPVGRHLRGVFGSDYVHHVASISTEFRFSITRDLYKISLFNDLAVYGHLNQRSCSSGVPSPLVGVTPCYPTSHTAFPDTYQETGVVADAFGAGFHALIEGMIQVDVYFSLGIRTRNWSAAQGSPVPGLPPSTNDLFETGGAINLEKVY